MVSTLNAALSIAFLAVACYGIGAGVRALFAKGGYDALTEISVRLLLGLGALPFIMIALDLLRIPLHWSALLVLAAPGAIWCHAVKRERFAQAQSRASQWALLAALAMCVVLAAVMMKGAFGYPYLEDDDPWGHAQGTLYVAQEMTYRQAPGDLFAHYLAPYPPYYDGLMGMLARISDDVPWTLKFFNALLVGLMLLPAYLFFAWFMKSERIALMSTAVLMAIPSFASHFIWAQTYALLVLFVALMAIAKAREEKEWLWAAALMTASSIVIQPSAALMSGLLILFFWIGLCAHAALNGRPVLDPASKRVLAIGAIGLGIGILCWGYLWAFYGSETLRAIGVNLDVKSGFGIAQEWRSDIYGFPDLWSAPTSSKIDQATGIGPIVMTLVILAIALCAIRFRQAIRKEWVVVGLVWLGLGLLYIHGNRYPYPPIFVHRYWPWLAVPIAMMAALPLASAWESIKHKGARIALVAVVLIAVVATSGYAKYSVQTAQWPPGMLWSSGEELQGYIEMGERLPRNSRVFAVCDATHSKVVGFGMHDDPWDPEVRAFRKRAMNSSAQEFSDFLATHRYQYFTLDSTCLKEHTPEQLEAFLSGLQQARSVSPALQTRGFLLAEVR